MGIVEEEGRGWGQLCYLWGGANSLGNSDINWYIGLVVGLSKGEVAGSGESQG